MQAELMTPTQVMHRHGGELERMGHIPAADGRSRRVTLTGISVVKDGAGAETLMLRMANAADVVPFANQLRELSDPTRNARRTPLHQAIHGMPIKYTFSN